MSPRSVAACLASILGVGVAEVPVPEEGHPDPWTVWRNWLAQRGLGLVPIAQPRDFDWPGPWLAVMRDGTAAVAFGAPPGLLAGGELDDVELGYVIAAHDVALWTAPARATPSSPGRVEAILVAAEAEAPMGRVERVRASAGRGLEGDRHFHGRGTFSSEHGRGQDLTLIRAEVLEELRLAPEGARRNVVVRGIDLDGLVGRRFRIGEVECLGQRLCEPCAHLERLVPGTLRPLVHRGGLRADVLTDGEIAAGDEIAAL